MHFLNPTLTASTHYVPNIINIYKTTSFNVCTIKKLFLKNYLKKKTILFNNTIYIFLKKPYTICNLIKTARWMRLINVGKPEKLIIFLTINNSYTHADFF